MGVRQYRPITAGSRHRSVSDFAEITHVGPQKRLVERLPRTGGRNFNGRITCRHIGGGNVVKYRHVDFRRDKDNIAARVSTVEYDPNRSARIALLTYADGEKRYILAPKEIQVGDLLMSGEKVEPRPGNAMPLSGIPVGLQIHNVELVPGQGGKMIRTAGGVGQLVAREGDYAHVLLPSGSIRRVHVRCRATIGQLGNIDHATLSWGKAGKTRWLGIRPTVRGTAQNPVCHPMGGGEGRSGGGRHPCSPWGKPAKGGRTRKERKPSSRFIVRRRKSGRFQR
ncbi:MAG: 50S ribosomal protein L2 [Planctomycetes bacterium]|nr:50S ribosomal protein L2 [Planctomycetota bacterium]